MMHLSGHLHPHVVFCLSEVGQIELLVATHTAAYKA